MGKLHTFSTFEGLENLIHEAGFLPFFANEVAGFSIEECSAREIWFADDTEGPWGWKGPLIQRGRCAYGKLFGKKAGFVSLEWFPYLANWRRNGYDFDARYDDGLSSWKDKQIYDALEKAGAALSRDLKKLCGEPKGFEICITRMQMQTYITTADFAYMQDKHGKPYGWGVSRYETAEHQLGGALIGAAYGEEPEASRRRIIEYLHGLLPHATEEQITKIVG